MNTITDYIPTSFNPLTETFKNMVKGAVADTAKKVMEVAFYTVRFTLAAGAVAFGLINLMALNFVIGSVSLTLGVANLYHIYTNLTNQKTESRQEFKRVEENLVNASQNLNEACEEIQAINHTADEQKKTLNQADELANNLETNINKIQVLAEIIKVEDNSPKIQENIAEVARLNVENQMHIGNLKDQLGDALIQNQNIKKNAETAEEKVKEAQTKIDEAIISAEKAEQAAENTYKVGTLTAIFGTAAACVTAGPIAGVIAGGLIAEFFAPNANNQEVKDENEVVINLSDNYGMDGVGSQKIQQPVPLTDEDMNSRDNGIDVALEMYGW